MPAFQQTSAARGIWQKGFIGFMKTTTNLLAISIVLLCAFTPTRICAQGVVLEVVGTPGTLVTDCETGQPVGPGFRRGRSNVIPATPPRPGSSNLAFRSLAGLLGWLRSSERGSGFAITLAELGT